jgi:hypothetical protein
VPPSESDIRTIIQTLSYFNKMEHFLPLKENEDISRPLSLLNKRDIQHGLFTQNDIPQYSFKDDMFSCSQQIIF